MKQISVGIFLLLLSSVGFGQLINDGTLIKAYENDSVYLVFNRELHHVPTLKVFNELFVPNAKVESCPLIELETLPKASPLYNAQIIKGESSAVFLTFSNYKTHIGNIYTFNTLQFDWSKIKLVKQSDISRLKTLSPIELYKKEVTSFEILDCGVE